MVNLQKSDDSAVKIVFTDSDHYLYGNGEIEVPVNSLLLVIDDSEMVTFKKLSGDPFLSFRADNSNLGTKEAIEQFYKENMVGSTGGGGSESGITSGEVQTMIDESISGKADTSAVTAVNDALTAHTANTSIHVTSAEKTTWNNKSDFSGDYNDLTNKPTIPTVPTNISDFTNDAGYITNADITGKADTSAVTAAIDAAVSGKVDTSAITTSITSGSTDAEIPTAKAVYDATQSGGGGMDDDTQQLISTALNDLNDRKADLTELSKYQKKGDYVVTSTLADYMTNDAFDEYATAKERIISGALNDLDNRMTAVESGGSVTVDTTLDSGSTNPVANSAITTAIDAKQDALSAGTGIEISGNVISATGGGGATYSAGTNISIANDTINCTLPITANTNDLKGYLLFGNGFSLYGSDTNGRYHIAIGKQISNPAYAQGQVAICPADTSSASNSVLTGEYPIGIGHLITSRGNGAVAIGDTANANGNGYVAIGQRVNATGTTKMNLNNQIKVDTNNQVYIKDKTNTTDVCIQDAIAALGGLKLVKISQADYDNLATKDSSTLYIISD